MSNKNFKHEEDLFINENLKDYNPFPPLFRYEPEDVPQKSVKQPAIPPVMTQDEQFVDPALTNIAYTQAFLKTIIGKRVRVTFLIGTTTLTDRTGVLVNVGASYIVLKMPESNTHIMCDLYSIKFVDYYA